MSFFFSVTSVTALQEAEIRSAARDLVVTLGVTLKEGALQGGRGAPPPWACGPHRAAKLC